jgi:hypothetical protein
MQPGQGGKIPVDIVPRYGIHIERSRHHQATASLKEKEPVVTDDDATTTVNKLLDATLEAGYSSEVKGAKAK